MRSRKTTFQVPKPNSRAPAAIAPMVKAQYPNREKESFVIFVLFEMYRIYHLATLLLYFGEVIKDLLDTGTSPV